MIASIEKLIAAVGKAVAWLNVLLVILIVVDVILRASFNLTAVWVTEVQWHLFALIFLLGAPYALQEDRHVRVDLFYEKFSAPDRRKVNVWGTLIFLIPWCVLLLVTGAQYAYEAFINGEGSPNPGGLPTFFPIKLMIPTMAFLLLLQGIAIVFKRSFKTTAP
ncbi:MAG: TRAP transporter small permease subunit [Bacteroidota bacterium]